MEPLCSSTSGDSPGLCDRFFRGRDSIVERGESPLFRPLSSRAFVRHQSKPMVKPENASRKVLPFAVPQPSMESKLEKWFRGVMQSNQDLMVALERLRDSY